MGFQMAGLRGVYGLLLIYHVLCILMTNPFGQSFLKSMSRDVFKYMIKCYSKKILEPSKHQKHQIFNLSIKVFIIGGCPDLLWYSVLLLKKGFDHIETCYFKGTFKEKFYRNTNDSKCKNILLDLNFTLLYITSILRASHEHFSRNFS